MAAKGSTRTRWRSLQCFPAPLTEFREGEEEEEFRKSVSVWWSYDNKLASYFLTHGVVITVTFNTYWSVSYKLRCYQQQDGTAYLALDGPKMMGSNDELAVMASSGMSPECIPNAARHLAANNIHSAAETFRNTLTYLLFFSGSFKITVLIRPYEWNEYE